MRKIRYVEIGGINAVVRKNGEVDIAPEEQQGAPWFSLPAGAMDPDCVVVRRDWRELANSDQLRTRVLDSLDSVSGEHKADQERDIDLEPQGPSFS